MVRFLDIFDSPPPSWSLLLNKAYVIKWSFSWIPLPLNCPRGLWMIPSVKLRPFFRKLTLFLILSSENRLILMPIFFSTYQIQKCLEHFWFDPFFLGQFFETNSQFLMRAWDNRIKIPKPLFNKIKKLQSFWNKTGKSLKKSK